MKQKKQPCSIPHLFNPSWLWLSSSTQSRKAVEFVPSPNSRGQIHFVSLPSCVSEHPLREPGWRDTGLRGSPQQSTPQRLLMEPVSRGRGFPAKSLMNKICRIFLIFPFQSCSVGLAVSVAEACQGPGWVGIPTNAQRGSSGLGGKCKNGEVCLRDSFF